MLFIYKRKHLLLCKVRGSINRSKKIPGCKSHSLWLSFYRDDTIMGYSLAMKSLNLSSFHLQNGGDDWTTPPGTTISNKDGALLQLTNAVSDSSNNLLLISGHNPMSVGSRIWKVAPLPTDRRSIHEHLWMGDGGRLNSPEVWSRTGGIMVSHKPWITHEVFDTIVVFGRFRFERNN